MAATMTIFVKEATKETPIQTLEAILTEMDGVERALVDIEEGEVKITYDENRLSEMQIEEKIEQAGFHINH